MDLPVAGGKCGDADGNSAAVWDMAACVGGAGAIYYCLLAAGKC